MSNTQTVQTIFGVLLAITGVSHVLVPQAWCSLFADLRKLSYGGLVVGLVTLLTGLTFVGLHNRWVLEPGVVVTLIAWGWTIKGTTYLVKPSWFTRVSRRATESPKLFKPAGWVMLMMGTGLIVDAVSRSSIA